MTTGDISLENIERAAAVIDPLFRNTPQYVDEQLSRELGRRVLVKIETTNPLRCFKGRGADLFMRTVSADRRVACSSAGNFGAAIAYTGARRGLEVRVFADPNVNPLKADRMRALGASVSLDPEPKAAARAFVAKGERDGWMFVEDGLEAAITEGAGTIGLELLAAGQLDTVIVQIGDGALIAGIGHWIKGHSPNTKVIGVCATGARTMADSWRSRKAISGSSDTIADGIAITDPIPESVTRMLRVVDDIVLVDDEAMLDAMRLAKRTLGLLLEPAGAAGLAAIATNNVPGEHIAVVLTGSNVNPSLAI